MTARHTTPFEGTITIGEDGERATAQYRVQRGEVEVSWGGRSKRAALHEMPITDAEWRTYAEALASMLLRELVNAP